MIKQLNILMNKIKNPFVMLSGAFWFTIENYRKRYPHVLLGEKQSGAQTNCEETILLYVSAKINTPPGAVSGPNWIIL